MTPYTDEVIERIAQLRDELARVTCQRDEAFKAGFDLVVYGRAGDTPGLDVYWKEAQIRLGNAMREAREQRP